MSINERITKPFQKAEKLPATKPDRMFNEAPPWEEALTTSFTCREWVLAKTFVNSGMSAPASVPQLMMLDSTHQRPPIAWLPVSAEGPSRNQLAAYVTPMETSEVIQTRWVRGASRSKSFRPPYFALLRAPLIQ